MIAELIKVLTNDQIYLSGLFVASRGNKRAILHIHGFEGDFYTNDFIPTISEAVNSKDIAFLSLQTRGTGKSTEFYTPEDGVGKVIGADFEILSEAHLDISAGIKFLLDRGYSEIILQGHSLGTIKLCRYLFEGEFKDKVSKLVLICPFDKNFMIDSFTKGKWMEYVQQAKDQVEAGKGREQVPRYFDIGELSFQTYASWYEDTELGHIFDFYKPRYNFPVLNQIKIPVHIVVGTKDDFFHPSNPSNPNEAMQILLQNISTSSGKLIEGATHSFKGYEPELASEITNFCAK
jgi:pimeloyl-ACP methyl ester carboxylesterase